MLDDEQIRMRGGNDTDIAKYAHDVGYACMYPLEECDICKQRLGNQYNPLKQMTPEEYYQAPPQHIFDDIKDNARKIWETYSNKGGYRDEKLARIDIENVSDNAWYIVAMFDLPNQNKLLDMVQPETAEQIRRARGY